VIEGMLGLSYEKPVAHMREYLEILGPLSRGEDVVHVGDAYTARIQHIFNMGIEFSVLVAALGPMMLRLTGRLAAGTITWATGLDTLEGFVIPTIRAAAKDAGRPEPRIVAGFPVLVTNDVALGHEATLATFGHYKAVPSYRSMLDREGADGVEDVAIIGDEKVVTAELGRLRDAGVTDLCVFPFEDEAGSGERTLEVLASLSSGR
jgi:F420-dependent oxidoreductase-like protein